MKLINYYFATVSIFAICTKVSAQRLSNSDSVKKNQQDSIYDETLFQKVSFFFNNNIDSAVYYLEKEKAFSRKVGYYKGELRSQIVYATLMVRLGDLPLSIKIILKELPRAIEIHFWRGVAQCYYVLGLSYERMDDQKMALSYFLQAKAVVDSNEVDYKFNSTANVAKAYINLNMADSARYYADLAESVIQKNRDTSNEAYLLSIRGGIEVLRGNYKKGISYCLSSLLKISRDFNLTSFNDITIATAYQKLNRNDSAIHYAKAAYRESLLLRNKYLLIKATELLKNEYYSLSDYKNAFDYQQIMLRERDSLYSNQKAVEIQNELNSEAQDRRKVEEARAEIQNKIRLYIILGALSIIVITALFLLYTNSQSKKAIKILRLRNEQIDNQHKALEKAYADLKSTQTQLIQSEKMASLGELTAGIAHEIQNPLNFVNNFSEVNTELIEEAEQEIEKGNIDEVRIILNDIKNNEQKINHHGKRADAIVKGMLQHSRSSTGVKEPTDINALADEYLRLAYHGLRAKDKSFNADFKTDFDNSIGKINIIPQDIGRVLLNLINNAFYAVDERQKITKENLPTGQAGYQPTVFLSSKKSGDKIILAVKDNGNGIPQNIVDKIFQPFFTTKPTGQGTGLGLSLSYDIVKAHGGEIKVETKEGEGSTFIIQLPI
jgi:two-component system NtrC family sensor kinase